MKCFLVLLALPLALFTVACSDLDRSGRLLADDDTGDDDTGDDDDSAADPGIAFVDVTYCLDWNTITITSPPGMIGILANFGVSLDDFPLLLSPTAVSIPVHEILVVMAAARPATCDQDISTSTYDLTANQAGSYYSPHFSIGPSDISLNTQIAVLNLYEAVFEGDFTGDASQVIHGSITGRLDVSAYSGLLCGALTGWNCTPCPVAGATCVDLVAEDGVWTDNGQGPLMVVP